MAFKDILAISGHSGLYKLVSQARNGIVVESLSDGKRTHVAASAKVSPLTDISIFSTTGEIPLGEVLEKLRELENGGPTISSKSSNDELKSFFTKILPNYDADRVYASDIKKVVAWYNQLQSLGMLDFSKPTDDKSEENAKAEDAAKEPTEKKPAAKTKPTTVKKEPAKSKTMGAGKGRATPKTTATRKT